MPNPGRVVCARVRLAACSRRGLIRDGGVTAVVIACLALGIGINATLFSVVDGVLIQPLPFADPIAS